MDNWMDLKTAITSAPDGTVLGMIKRNNTKISRFVTPTYPLLFDRSRVYTVV